MDNWSAVEKILVSCSGFTLLLTFYSALFSSISARATVATVQNAQQRKRFTVYIHLAAFSFVLLTTGYVVAIHVSNSPSASANSSQSTTVTCPCPDETKQTNENSPSEAQPSPSSSVSSSEAPVIPSKRGTDFEINSIRFDYSPNALMGRFPGTLVVEDGRVKFAITDPIFRLAGRADIWGQRTITGLKIGIGDYEEIVKVSHGQKANVIWSERFDLSTTRDHGEEFSEELKIELSIDVGMAGLANKAVIIQIDNELTSCGNSLTPAYALSSKDIFY